MKCNFPEHSKIVAHKNRVFVLQKFFEFLRDFRCTKHKVFEYPENKKFSEAL